MSKYKIDPLSPKKLKTYPLDSRKSKIKVDDLGKPYSPQQPFADFISGLPDILASGDFKKFIKSVVRARKNNSPIICALGAHVIKVGLNPVLIDLMKEGWIQALALNGAGIIHDFELAFAGKTSEDVAQSLGDGSFGMAEETGTFLNDAINTGAKEDLGLGESVGRFISDSNYPYKNFSLLSAAYDMDIPVTVHVAVGTDIIHIHPNIDGEALGKTTLKDFFLLCALIKTLEGGGVFIQIGSAVILPEVFLKCLSFVRNQGAKVEQFTTAVFDFIHHYRPYQNIVKRPAEEKAKGYYFIGHHEIMIPLLAAALKSEHSSSAD